MFNQIQLALELSALEIHQFIDMFYSDFQPTIVNFVNSKPELCNTEQATMHHFRLLQRDYNEPDLFATVAFKWVAKNEEESLHFVGVAVQMHTEDEYNNLLSENTAKTIASPNSPFNILNNLN